MLLGAHTEVWTASFKPESLICGCRTRTPTAENFSEREFQRQLKATVKGRPRKAEGTVPGGGQDRALQGLQGKVDGREEGVSRESPLAPAAGKQAPALPSVDLEADAAHLGHVHLTLLAAVLTGSFSAPQAAVSAPGGAEHAEQTTILQKRISKFEELVMIQQSRGYAKEVSTRARCPVSRQTVSKLKPQCTHKGRPNVLGSRHPSCLSDTLQCPPADGSLSRLLGPNNSTVWRLANVPMFTLQVLTQSTTR